MKNMMKRIKEAYYNPEYRQFIKYSLVGVLNTVIYYAIYYVILQLGFSYVIAVTVGTVISVANSYFWNKLFVFKSKKKSTGEVVRFIIVYGVQYVCNIIVIYICINYIGLSAEIAGIPAIVIGVFISFFGHKFWSFRKKEG